jgi:hypothetical protein
VDIPASFIVIIILFDEGFECVNDVKLLGYVGTNADPLCLEFCSCVQYHIFKLFNFLLNILRKVG